MPKDDEKLQLLFSQRSEARRIAAAAQHAHDFIVKQHKKARMRLTKASHRTTQARMTLHQRSSTLFTARSDTRSRIRLIKLELNQLRSEHREAAAYIRQAKRNREYNLARQWITYDQQLRRLTKQAQSSLEQLDDEQLRLTEDYTQRQEALSDCTRREQQCLDEWNQLEREYYRSSLHLRAARRRKRIAEQQFDARREQLRREADELKEEDAELARSVGVPEKYVYNLDVERRDSGIIELFFGTISPKDLDHAHYALDPAGVLYYRREIGEPHGPQNYLTQQKVE